MRTPSARDARGGSSPSAARPKLALTAIGVTALALAAPAAYAAPALPTAAPSTAATAAPATAASRAALPPVGHVFVVVLENKSYAQSFSPISKAPYLTRLARAGAFVPNYYGTAHFSLPNYVALLSGQGPNADTQSDCQTYTDMLPGTPAASGDGQVVGQGCVYPSHVGSLPAQLTAAHRTWKGYLEDLGKDSAREQLPCGTPATDSARRDRSQTATAKDQYAARHNPFAYFHAITDHPELCKKTIAPLTALPADLKSAATTPALSVIVPNLCNDGHDSAGCVGADVAGDRTGGLTAVQHWLTRYVPMITGSPAFRRNGLLIVTWDEAAASSGRDGNADSSACCHERSVAANSPLPGGASQDISGAHALSGPGGGRVGALLVSPFIAPGTVTQQAYNHYSTLRTIEDLFRLPRLGYAASAGGATSFGRDVFTRLPRPAH